MKRIILFAFVALFSMPTASAQSPLELFQQALRLESVQGDLEGAIALYERVGSSFGSDRALGARALFRMGQAYETLGQNDATRTYRRIVSEFADQAETVAMAEARLGELVAPSLQKSVELDPSLTSDSYRRASFSHDGRFFSNTDYSSNSLGYQEVGKPGVTYITEQFADPGPNSDLAYPGRFSPDNRYIAYVWWDGTEKTHWLHVYDRQTEETRILFNNEARVGITPGEAYAYFEVYDWTSDSRSVLITAYDGPNLNGFDLIDASSGDLVRTVTPDVEGVWSDAMCLIEDRYVVFNRTVEGKKIGYRVDFETGETKSLLPGASTSTVIGCSDTANLAVVRTDLIGEVETWVFELEAGLPTGVSAPIRDMASEASGMGLTDSGTLHYYRAFGNRRRFEVLPFSKDTWAINGSGELLEEGTGFRIGWARETGRMAYMASMFGFDLRLRETDGSEVSVDASSFYRVPPDGWTMMSLSADGSTLFAFTDSDDGTTLRVDAETGAVIDTLAVNYGTADRIGSTMLVGRRRDAATMCVDAYSGIPAHAEEVVCFPDDVSENVMMKPSGDGKWILIGFGGKRMRVDRRTGDVKILFDGEKVANLMFAPGSTDLVFMGADRKYYTSDLEGQNAKLIFPRLQEVRRIFQPIVFHPTEPLIMIDSSRKPTDDSGKVLYTIEGLRSRLGG